MDGSGFSRFPEGSMYVERCFYKVIYVAPMTANVKGLKEMR